jgi:predicted RND superfamily exporter protein
MSMIYLMGWEFGLIESICVIVFIGISVDYVSHLGHMYIHAPNENSKERTDYAYRQMGQTILGGALTSCFSGFFLIICNVGMLNKFGILFITTIIASFLTSLIFLPSFLYVFGPNNETGSIRCYKSCKGVKAKINVKMLKNEES